MVPPSTVPDRVSSQDPVPRITCQRTNCMRVLAESCECRSSTCFSIGTRIEYLSVGMRWKDRDWWLCFDGSASQRRAYQTQRFLLYIVLYPMLILAPSSQLHGYRVVVPNVHTEQEGLQKSSYLEKKMQISVFCDRHLPNISAPLRSLVWEHGSVSLDSK